VKRSLLPLGVSILRSLIVLLVPGSVFAALLACGTAAPLKEPTNAGLAVAGDAPATATLEREFWVCDYVATKQLVDLGMAGHCSAVTEELKQAEFGDDFSAMLVWWQRNKATEHAALEHAMSE
jgi:hypothetical protein